MAKILRHKDLHELRRRLCTSETRNLVAHMRRYAKQRFGEARARAAGDFADPAQSEQLSGPWSVYVFEVEGRPIVEWFLEERGARLGWTSARGSSRSSAPG